MGFSIEVHDRKFKTKLFDKRGAFPYLDSTIPSKIFHALVGSEILPVFRSDKYDNTCCWYRWKSKVVNVFISFHHWKRSLGNTLKCFIRLQMHLMNLFLLTTVLFCLCVKFSSLIFLRCLLFFFLQLQLLLILVLHMLFVLVLVSAN